MPSTYATTHKGRHYSLGDLKSLMAKASPKRSADELAGLAAASEVERALAQRCLAEVPLQKFLDDPLIAPESDEVTRLIQDRHDAAAFAPIRGLCVGEFREWLLSHPGDPSGQAWGITPEMAAAVSKIMRNQDLIAVARKCRVVTQFRNTLGLENRLSTRLQPNHPTDDIRGVAATILDGLLYGSGDAVIGINPATDHLGNVGRLLHLMSDLIETYEIPTQACVLSHVTTTMELIQHPGHLRFR